MGSTNQHPDLSSKNNLYMQCRSSYKQGLIEYSKDVNNTLYYDRKKINAGLPDEYAGFPRLNQHVYFAKIVPKSLLHFSMSSCKELQ